MLRRFAFEPGNTTKLMQYLPQEQVQTKLRGLAFKGASTWLELDLIPSHRSSSQLINLIALLSRQLVDAIY